MLDVAALFVRLLEIYAVIGVVFAIYFVALGISKVDRLAHGSGIGFRLLVFPGSAALWPLLLLRLLRASGDPPEEGNPHR